MAQGKIAIQALKDYKEYSISKFEDMNSERFVKPNRKVFVDFTFSWRRNTIFDH